MISIGVAAGFLVAAAARFFLADRLDRVPGRVVLAVVAASAAVAAFAEGAPTGVAGVDALARMGLAAAVAAAASAAPVVVLVAAAVVAAAAVGLGSSADVVAGAPIGIALAQRFAGSSSPLLHAATGGLAVNAALRLDDGGTTGASAVAAAVALVPLLVAGWRRLSKPVRRRALLAIGAYLVLGAVGSVGAAVAAARSVDGVSDATAAAERGIDLLGDDDGGARAALDEAAAGFDEVRDRFDAPWVLPARLVPFVAQQARAVRTMADVGAELSEAAASAAGVDLDAVQPVDGAVDLEAFEEAMVPVRDADRRLASADERLDDVGSPWLLAPVADRFDRLRRRVTDAAVTASIAADVGEVLPAMLGQGEERRYLLLMQQPAEARGAGGLPGNWGEIVAVDGRLELVASGRISDLDTRGTPPAERVVEASDAHRRLFAYQAFQDVLWQNTTMDPDFGTGAAIVRQLWEQSGGDPIDGVLSVDPFAIRALLGIVGPLALADGTVLDAGNVVPFLLNEQYALLEDDAARIDALGEAVDLSWAALTSGALPGPRLLANAFAPAVDGRHLLFTSFDDDERRVLDRLGLSGTIPTPTSDGVGVVTVNLGQNKIDWFLTRTAEYRANWDTGTGGVTGTYTVTLANAAPASGQPDAVVGYGGPLETDPNLPPGVNLLQAYVYTALQPTAVRLDGQAAEVGLERDDRGWYVSVLVVRVPVGGTATIEVEVAGVLAEAEEYRLDVLRQPPVNADRLQVEVVASGGASAPEGSDLQATTGGSFGGDLGLERPVDATLRAE